MLQQDSKQVRTMPYVIRCQRCRVKCAHKALVTYILVSLALSQMQKTKKACPRMASPTSCLCTTMQSPCLRLVEKSMFAGWNCFYFPWRRCMESLGMIVHIHIIIMWCVLSASWGWWWVMVGERERELYSRWAVCVCVCVCVWYLQSTYRYDMHGLYSWFIFQLLYSFFMFVLQDMTYLCIHAADASSQNLWVKIHTHTHTHAHAHTHTHTHSNTDNRCRM